MQLAIIQMATNHLSRLSGAVLEDRPDLGRELAAGWIALHSHMRRVLMKRTSVRPHVGQHTPSGQRRLDHRGERHVRVREVADGFDEGEGFVAHEATLGGAATESSMLLPYFGYGTRLQAYRAVDNHVYESVRHFLVRRHKVRGRGTQRFPYTEVFGPLGVLHLRRVHVGPPPWALR